MEIQNTKMTVYSRPEINVFDISAGKVFCTSKASTDTEIFSNETFFTW